MADSLPPDNIHISEIDPIAMHVTLAWNQSCHNQHCSSASYTVVANGGCNVFPNTTVYTNTSIIYTNMTINGQNCTFQLHTIACENIVGNGSDPLLVIIKGINTIVLS